jgi:hypothetical protein
LIGGIALAVMLPMSALVFTQQPSRSTLLAVQGPPSDVDSTMTQGDIPRIDEVMRRSPDIVSFLQCETRLSDPLQQKFADIVCANVIGK